MVKSIYNWLITNGLYKDLLAFSLAILWAKILRIGKRLKDLADKLDTSTPGGLKDVVDAVEGKKKRALEDVDAENSLRRLPRILHRRK